MSRTLAERARDWKWWGEQVLHLLFVAAPPTAAILGLHQAGFTGWQVAAGFLASSWIAGLREFDQRPVSSWGDMLVDLAFSIAGGTLVGLSFFLKG